MAAPSSQDYANRLIQTPDFQALGELLYPING
jgi:hypothetical protein